MVRRRQNVGQQPAFYCYCAATARFLPREKGSLYASCMYLKKIEQYGAMGRIFLMVSWCSSSTHSHVCRRATFVRVFIAVAKGSLPVETSTRRDAHLWVSVVTSMPNPMITSEATF